MDSSVLPLNPDPAGTSGCDVARAISDIAAGRPVIVLSGEGDDGEGDLVVAAESATRERLAFMVRHTAGFIRVAILEDACRRLQLPPMVPWSIGRAGASDTVTVDAIEEVTTGVSARDRARTIRLLAARDSSAADFARPGHVAPLRVDDDGVLGWPGRAEAAVDLARLAGLRPAAALCAVVSCRDGTRMAGSAELAEFAAQHHLWVVTITDLVRYRQARDLRIDRSTTADS